MDEWLKQIQADIHQAARDSSDWFAAVSMQSNQMIDQWVESSLETIEEIDAAVMQTLDNQVAPALADLNDQVDQAAEASFVFLDQEVRPRVEEAARPVTHTVNPWLQNHTPCIGCRHYHGTAYGGEMLICGMHPYGVETTTCSDWDSVWPTPEDADSSKG